MRAFWYGMLVIAAASQVGLDLDYFNAPDSVILVGMVATGIIGYLFIVKRELEEDQW